MNLPCVNLHHLMVTSRSTCVCHFMEVVVTQRPMLCEMSSAILFNPVGLLLRQPTNGPSRSLTKLEGHELRRP